MPGEILVRLSSEMIALVERGSADAAVGEAEFGRAADRLGELVGARETRLISGAPRSRGEPAASSPSLAEELPIP